MKYQLIHAALKGTHTAGLGRLLSPVMGGMGCILTLHHVRPYEPQAFHPNRLLEITPAFLSSLILSLKKSGYTFISMDEVAERLQSRSSHSKARFIAMTLDDGYVDNLIYAAPIFRAHHVPYCIYIPTAYPSGEGILWWIALEAIIRQENTVVFMQNEVRIELPTRSLREKQLAWTKILQRIHTIHETDVWLLIRQIAHHAGYDLQKLTRDLVMSWDQLRALTQDPWCTLGAHTMTHSALAKCSEHWVQAELNGSVNMLEAHTGQRSWHLAYPYGGLREAGQRDYNLAHDAGFLTAVTMRPGVITRAHAQRMTALPRISVNGLFQNLSEMQTLCSGFPVRLLGN